MSKLNYGLPNYREIAKGVKFWRTIRKDNDLTVKIYFDSASVIDMLTGIGSVYRGSQFQQHLYERPANLVYALAQRSWLGDIYLLPPHTEELVDSLLFNDRLFPSHRNKETEYQKEELWQKIINSNELKTLQNLLSQAKYMSTNILNEVKRHPYHIFIGLYLSSGDNYWKLRYKNLVKEQEIIKFSHQTDYEFGSVTKSKLFRKVTESLNQQRARTANNFVDAIALCLLERKLRRIESQPDVDKVIPLFFSDQEHILNTVQELSQQVNEETGKRPFMYYDPNQDIRFPVVRNASFFIIEGFMNAMQANAQNNQRTTEEEPFELDKVLSNILKKVGPPSQRKLFDLEIEQLNTRYLEPNLHQKVLLEFFDRWWKEEGPKEINKILELEYADKGKIDTEINELIEEDRRLLRRKIRGHSPRISTIKKAWHYYSSFSEVARRKYIIANDSTDAYNEFGPRYNFSEKVCKRIQDWIYQTIEATKQEDDKELKNIISEVISDLIFGLFEKGEEDDKLDTFAASIGFFYFFEQYDLVQDACEIIREQHSQGNDKNDQYPIPAIAFIHAACLFKSRRNDLKAQAESKALIVADCVRHKSDKNYKIWIGLSYLYNLLWEHRTNNYRFKELYSPDEFSQQVLPSKGYAFLEKAIDYSKKAIDHIEILMREDDDPEKLRSRRRKYYYALNNYLFFKTLYSPAKTFKELNFLRKKLEDINHDEDNFQKDRFSDTLSRFFFRSAILAEDEEDFTGHMQDAIFYNDISKRTSSKDLYQSLSRDLQRWNRPKKFAEAKRLRKGMVS